MEYAEKKCMESTYNSMAEILRKERDILARITEIQSEVRSSAEERRWLDFEAAEKSIGLFESQIALLESELTRLSGGKKIHFYHFALTFPDAERRELCALHRQIRSLAGKVRSENNALRDYVASQSALVNRYLEAAFPERLGKLYSRFGAKRDMDIDGIVLNTKV
jgi:hypothetical protein